MAVDKEMLEELIGGFFREKRLKKHISAEGPQYSDSIDVHPIPDTPDEDVSSNFVPYEGADMTNAEAGAAGFEFSGSDSFHGVDGILGEIVIGRNLYGKKYVRFRGIYGNYRGMSGCAVGGYHGNAETEKIPRSINGRPVLKIEKNAFENTNIREVYIPDTVLEIEDSAFSRCQNLTYARLSRKLVRIGISAFCGCTALEKVYLGNALIIEKAGFCECGRLMSVRLPDKLALLGDEAFAHSGVERLYWKKIECGGDSIVFDTPYEKNHSVILLGDCLQKCSVRAKRDVIADCPYPIVRAIGSRCFCETSARRVILPEHIREIKDEVFLSKPGYKIDEIYIPKVFAIGSRCFSKGQKTVISPGLKNVSPDERSFTGFLRIEEDSFKGNEAEKLYMGGSSEKPCVCVMAGNILERVEKYDTRFSPAVNIRRGILILSKDGSTLTMDGRVEYTAAKTIPTLGAKRLILGRNLCNLRSFASVENFGEIIVSNPEIFARDFAREAPFRPNRSVILRFNFEGKNSDGSVDSAFLFYLPPVTGKSEEAERLYELYDRCLGTEFTPSIYDREILDLVSSYRARFTIARLRLEGGHRLEPEARDAYENFLLLHKRKAEFTAKKYGDNRLLALLEKLSANLSQSERSK